MCSAARRGAARAIEARRSPTCSAVPTGAVPFLHDPAEIGMDPRYARAISDRAVPDDAAARAAAAPAVLPRWKRCRPAGGGGALRHAVRAAPDGPAEGGSRRVPEVALTSKPSRSRAEFTVAGHRCFELAVPIEHDADARGLTGERFGPALLDEPDEPAIRCDVLQGRHVRRPRSEWPGHDDRIPEGERRPGDDWHDLEFEDAGNIEELRPVG